jgi:hypothetical protein
LERTGVTYGETEFVGARANGARFSDCRVLDVRFDGLDAADIVAPRSTWRGVEITGPRLGTLGPYDAEVSGLRLDRCKVGYFGDGRAVRP